MKCCTRQCYDKLKYKLKKIPTIKTCLCCGVEFNSKQGQSKYCSAECRIRSISEEAKVSRETYTRIAEAHVRVSFCVVCNEFCDAPYQGNLRKFCSASCENKNIRSKPYYRAKRSRLDALKRNASKAERIDPIDVLNRDGWICYLCGIPTPKNLRGTYEFNAPEVDHIVPLSRGGSHSMNNLRCACRKCNNKKANHMID
ncbi:HNH endonuclease [Acinetobacter tandoii]